MSLNGGFKAPQTKGLQPVDNRLYNNKEPFNQKLVNKVYQANSALLQEIEDSRRVREIERSRRQLQEENPAIEFQQVEEISPSGVKRQVIVNNGTE